MKIKILILLLVIGIVLISGCAQKECKVKEDCPDKTCFTKDCVDYNCSYSKLVPCPECDDKDECTEDLFDYGQQKCVTEPIIPCCGNEECETGETYLTCPQDCPKTIKDVLEENIPEIKNYPKLEQVFIDLYAPNEFIEEEIEFMKIALDIYKEKPELKEYPKEILYYFAFRFPERFAKSEDKYIAPSPSFFNQTIRKTAISLKKDNDMETAKSIYGWVNDYIEIEKHVEELDISYVPGDVELIWKYKAGKCQEKSYLIIMLLRSIGIPARGISSDELSHRWIEIYFDGSWIPIDSTGALDSDKDGLVDFQDRIAEDPIITPYLENMEDLKREYYPTKYIGYKYSTYHAQQILKLAKYNNFKEFANDYISKWKSTDSWEKRGEHGENALKYAIASVFGEEKLIYGPEDIEIIALPKPYSVILAILSEGKPDWTKWHYEPKSANILSILIRNPDRDVHVIFVDKNTGDVVILYPADINTLSNTAKDFNETAPTYLANFIEIISDIQNNKIQTTDLALPESNLFISGIDRRVSLEEYMFVPKIISYKNVGGIDFSFEKHTEDISFKNIRFLDENNDQIIDLTENGYYKVCFSKLRIPSHQTLSLRKDGDYTIVQGEMWLE